LSRSKQVQIFNDFTKGLITEASGLNFPENACTETWDCQFSNTGVVSRRLGFDYESSFELDAKTRSDGYITEYVWRGVNGDGNLTYVVVQVGSILYFYEQDPVGPLSPGHEVFSIDLANFDIAGAPDTKTQPCQFSTGKGWLFVTHPYCNPFYLQYDSVIPEMDATIITIQIRDFEGLASTATYPDAKTRPTSTYAALADFDDYNLLNRGWGEVVKNAAATTVTAISYWDTSVTTMPALNEYWWYYLDATEIFTATLFDTEGFPNSFVSAGHYILNAFLQERDVASGIAGLSTADVTSSYFRPKTSAFFAGRVWYAGVDYLGFNSKVYYSQVIETPKQLGYCYQLNDPTSRNIRDIIASDGGVIDIQDIASVIKLFVFGNNLLVFATNGVWAISGSGEGGSGFSGVDYSIKKLSAVRAVSPLSFVDVEGTPIWWNYDGIWTVGQGQSNNPEVTSVTQDTIQTFFDSIPTENKGYAKGAFDRNNQIVQWVYRSDATSDVDLNMNYDRILNLSLRKGAFFPWTIGNTGGVFVNGVVTTRGIQTTYTEEAVTDGGVPVTDTSGDPITTFLSDEEIKPSVFKYLVSKLTSGTTFNFTWAGCSTTNYLDWDTATSGSGQDYDSRLVSGYNISGQAQRFFNTNYITVYLTNFPNSSCFFQNIWDYASSSDSARVSQSRQAYRERTLVSVQEARLKVRGKGRAVQFKFFSETGKPFFLHGWSTFITQNDDV
jgi:hypothetical protein